LEAAALYPIGMSPDEEVCKGKFRNQRRELEEKCIEEGFLFEG
jgi:hypothetical protein